jgi:hypothetical protein
VTELVAFEYPNQETARWCEKQAGEIREHLNRTIYTLAEIGKTLKAVQERIDLLFYPWVRWYFGWSDQTARNYMRLAELVSIRPQILGLRHLSLIYRLPSLPEKVQAEIIEAQPATLREAEDIIAAHKAREWKEAVEASIPTDPGGAWHAIERAMSDPVLRDAAQGLVNEYADEFAREADRDPWQIRAEAWDIEQEQEDRPVGSGRVKAQLVRGANCRVEVWNGGAVCEASTLVSFPAQTDPWLLAQRERVIRAVCKELEIGGRQE